MTYRFSEMNITHGAQTPREAKWGKIGEKIAQKHIHMCSWKCFSQAWPPYFF